MPVKLYILTFDSVGMIGLLGDIELQESVKLKQLYSSVELLQFGYECKNRLC